MCFPPRTVASPDFEAKAERYYARMDEALAEDIAMLERQQLGMDSPFARAGRWSDLERRGRRFRGVVREAPGAMNPRPSSASAGANGANR